MRAHSAVLLLFASALYCARTPLGAAEVPPAEDAAVWVGRLKHDDFDVRAEAADKLAALGETARPALESALKSDDLETRSAAAWLLAHMSHIGARFQAFDRNGKPIDGIEGTLTIYDNSNYYQTATRPVTPIKFNAGGVAEVPNLKCGTGTLSIAWQKGWIVGDPSNYGPGNSSTIAYLGGGMTPFLFSMTRGGSVKTSVLGPDGKPLKEAEVALYPTAIFNAEMLDTHSEFQPMRPVASGSSDAAGNIAIDSVNDGVYVCAVTGIKSPSVVGPTIRVREGQTTVVPPISVEPNQYGKFVALLSGVIDPLTADLDQQQMIQFVRANGRMPDKVKPDEPTKVEAARALQPAPLKNLKLAIDDDFIFDGPDGEAKTRKAIADRVRNSRYGRQTLLDTDEKGRLTLENLRPGKHRIRIKTDTFAAATLTVVIPAGGTFDAGAVPLDAGGSIVFKAQTYDGKPVTDLQVFAIPEAESALTDVPQEVLNYIRGQGTWDEARNYISYQRQISGRRIYDASDREKYTLKNLEPGKYAMLVSRQSSMTRAQQVFLVCGVTIEAGKTANGPALKFATPGATRVNDGIYIKGKVTGAGDEAVNRSTVYYQTNSGSTGTSLSSDGTFQIHMGNMGPGGIIRVKVPGFKQAEFDCAAPGVDLSDIQIKLEHLAYGSLRLKIVDEDGRPLAGVSVDPAPVSANNYNYMFMYNRRFGSTKKNSDARGEIACTGLSTGMRRIAVAKDGYYLTDPVRLSIRADTESVATVMLRKGLTVSGKLSAPAGAALNEAVVSARRKSDGVVFNGSVNAEGEFAVTGLTPEKYFLTAEAPMLEGRVEHEIDLVTDSKAGVTLDMVPKGGIAMRLDKRFAGRSLVVSEKADFEKMYNLSRVMYSAGASVGVVDAEGKAEFWNIKPGTYQVSIASAARPYELAAGADTDKYLRRIECSRLSEPFEIKAPKTFAELNLDDAQPLAFPEADASAVAKFVFRKSADDSAPRNPYVQSTTYLMIKGERCSGLYAAQTVRSRNANNGLGSAKLQVLGTLPPFLAPASSNGLTLIQGLVPGKYKLTAYSMLFDSMRGTQEQSEETVVAEFEVKAGERKELGPIVVEPSKTIARSTNTRRGGANLDFDAMPDEDLEPGFEP